MDKIDSNSLKLCDYHILQIKEHEGYVLEKDNVVLKIYLDERIKMLKKYGIDLEKKIQLADKMKTANIALPNAMIYEDGNFVGYTMKKIEGVCYSNIPCDSMTLYDYARLYEKFEELLEEASEDDIIVTDFANAGNIYFTNDDNLTENIIMIDYDDMQVEKYRTTTYSNYINSNLKNTPKYCKNGLYTKELNKLSLVYFYFGDVLNTKLKNIEQNMDNIYYLFNKTCHQLGLQDKNIIHELSKIYYQTEKNPKLSNIFYEIANNYEFSMGEGYTLVKK